MKLTIQTFLSLDGVMQAPGGPEEDRDGRFGHGGWSFTYGDEDFAGTIVEYFEHAGAFLLGRRTYDIFAGYWPAITDPANPIAAKLNALPKYVASTTLHSLVWPGASLLQGDVPEAVAALKRQPGEELQVHGSGQLAQTLMEHDLIDEYRLFTFPVHLGPGKRLFRDTTVPGALRLIDTRTTRSGIIASRYEPAGPVQHGSYSGGA